MRVWNDIVSLTRRLFAGWSPKSERESSDAVGFNFMLHWFPAKITRESLSWSYSFWLGTISLSLFIILAISGVVLMFLYVPSVERAYHTIKDIEFVVSFGWFIRRVHRWAAHGMVLFVFLHMLRVFLTAAYRSSNRTVRGDRPLNWIIGMKLFLLTMLLSYTGYLLPWDQLALWAIIIGANIAYAVPVIGPDIQFFMQGGTQIGQNTLIIWYAMHVAVLPLLASALIAWHMWRIRKDGGLAVVESLVLEKREEDLEREAPRSYTLMGVATGSKPTAYSWKLRANQITAIPAVVVRASIVFLFTLAGVMLLSLTMDIPLEEPASLDWTPNPAMAPWYFLWLQELVTITTIRIGGITLNGGFIGGVIIPGILMGIALLWPFLDRSSEQAIGRWFHPARKVQNAVFLFIIAIIVAMTLVGTTLRGPNWHIYWPGQERPHHADKY